MEGLLFLVAVGVGIALLAKNKAPETSVPPGQAPATGGGVTGPGAPDPLFQGQTPPPQGMPIQAPQGQSRPNSV